MNLPYRWTASATAVLLTLSAAAQTTTTPHRRAATSTAARRAAAPETVPGLAAAGTMSAVTGPAKPLYTLRYVDTVIGTGDLAAPSKFYTVHYTGWLTDGTKFDSSRDRNEPIVFPAGAHRVIIGWDTGFQGMHVGGKRRLLIPYQLAYGESGRPPVIPAKSDLVFDIELIAQSDTPPQQPAPPAAADDDAPKSQAPPATKPATQPGTNPVTKPAEKPE